jgi:hypothetical protein
VLDTPRAQVTVGERVAQGEGDLVAVRRRRQGGTARQLGPFLRTVHGSDVEADRGLRIGHPCLDVMDESGQVRP